MIQNIQDYCTKLAKYQSRQKVIEGTNVLENTFEANYSLSKKLHKQKQWKNI